MAFQPAVGRHDVRRDDKQRFQRGDEAIAKQAVDATRGFTLVLAGMKAWLEHGIELDLVRDRFPEGLEH
jgi:hypothetical protein